MGGVLFLPPSDAYVRSFLYLLYTLIKCYYTKALKKKKKKRWEYQTTWPASWEIYMEVKKQQLELNMEQQTGSK